jgi:hypothetical protein
MLTRIASVLLSFSLATSAVAGSFAQPPTGNTPHAVAAREDVADRIRLRKVLAAHRVKNLASFRAYRLGRVYPINTMRVGPLNVWRDVDGHLCAAATMMDKDGQHDLVMKTADANNYFRLLDVTSGPLLDWMMTSGFTLEEIDRIQAPMVMPTRMNREAEIQRLAKWYDETEKFLVENADAGLDLAVERLVTSNPELAKKLLAPRAL